MARLVGRTRDGISEKDVAPLVAQAIADSQGLIRYIALGDSITGHVERTGYAGILGQLAPGYLLYDEEHSSAGVSGQPTSGMLARVQTDVLDHHPDLVLFCGGSNDAAASIPLATYRNNVTAIIQSIREAGLPLIVMSVPPRDAVTERVTEYNAWLNAYCRSEGITFIDLFRMFADPATGAWDTTWSSDQVHPNGSGYLRIAKRICEVLNIPVGGGAVPLLTMTNNQPTNLLQNALFQVDTDSDGLADGWNLSGSGVATPSIEPPAEGDYGNWQRFDMTSGQRYLIRNANLGWPTVFAGDGDVLWYGFRYKGGGQEATGKYPTIHFNIQGGSGHTGAETRYVSAIDTGPEGLWITGTRKIGTGATHAGIDVTFNTADGGEWAAIAQPTILNLTALGLD